MMFLDLPLKKQWYEMIESGVKTEEYREIKPYWCKRLAKCNSALCWIRKGGNCQFVHLLGNLNRPGYTHVRFRYGYTKRTMLREIESISIGYGKPEWGAPTDRRVFIIKFKKQD
jgi:hypothetical protein